MHFTHWNKKSFVFETFFAKSLIFSGFSQCKKIFSAFAKSIFSAPKTRAQILSTVCFFVVFLVLKQIPDPFFYNLFSGFSAAEEQLFFFLPAVFLYPKIAMLTLSTENPSALRSPDLSPEYYAHEFHIFFCTSFYTFIKDIPQQGANCSSQKNKVDSHIVKIHIKTAQCLYKLINR